MKRFLAPVLVLTAVWCILWESVSWANLASGLLVSAALTFLGAGRPSELRIVWRPLVSLVGLVAKDLVKSTWVVVLEALTWSQPDDVIVPVDIPAEACRLDAFLVIAVTLTPGTSVVEVDHDESRLWVHILDREQREPVCEHVRELAEAAVAAFPSSAVDTARESAS